MRDNLIEFAKLIMLISIATGIIGGFRDLSREMEKTKWRLDLIANEMMLTRLCTFDHSRTTCKEATPGLK